jgi:MATE family multidrug resistance protein
MRVRAEFRQVITVAVPVVIVEVGLMFMGVVDTLMVGHLSASALAAVALGNLLTYNVAALAIGTVMSIDPVVSQAVGANDESAITRAVQRGVIMAVVLSIPTTIAMNFAGPLFTVFGQPADVIPDAALFSRINSVAMAPFLVFVAFRQVLQAKHRLAPILWTILIANGLNVLLNWVLVFGKLGAPALGVAGSAIATTVSRWAMALLLLALAWRELGPHLVRFDRVSFSLAPLRKMFALGIPIGFQLFLEISAFGTIGLLTGTFGTTSVASYQVALNLAALTFMVPLGISAAGSVRVGNAVGAGDAPRAREAARIAYMLGGGFMCASAVLFLTLPEELARLYTKDATVIATAALMIPIAGLFQVFDGMQAVGAGVLRGLGDTRVPFVAMLSGYWIIGVPVSVWLGFYSGMGAIGLWWGFVAGLASVSIFLLLRVRVLFRRGVSRLVIDSTADGRLELGDRRPE